MLLRPEIAVAFGRVPHLFEGLLDKGAARAQPRLALRDLRLDHVVVAQRVAGAARDLVARQYDEGSSAPRAMPSDTFEKPIA